jgi:hypothetical protein
MKTIERNWQHWVLKTQDEDNREKLATLGTQDTRRRPTKQKAQHNMCWAPLCANKYKHK